MTMLNLKLTSVCYMYIMIILLAAYRVVVRIRCSDVLMLFDYCIFPALVTCLGGNMLLPFCVS
jgi:hypothetical protein